MNRAVYGRLLGCVALTFAYQQPGWSENKPATPPAKGVCDSPYPDAQGNVSFTCRGLTDEQIRLMPSLSTLIEKLLHSGVESARLDSQTDNILKMLQTDSEAPGETMPSETRPTGPSLVPPSNRGPRKDREVFTYDYRGYKTSSLSGPMLLLGDAGESKRYQELLELQDAGEWKKLLKESTREIKKVPEWLTPYAFKAVALRHLKNNQEAIQALEYVDQHSKGNPDYDQVRRLLQKLKPATP